MKDKRCRLTDFLSLGRQDGVAAARATYMCDESEPRDETKCMYPFGCCTAGFCSRRSAPGSRISLSRMASIYDCGKEKIERPRVPRRGFITFRIIHPLPWAVPRCSSDASYFIGNKYKHSWFFQKEHAREATLSAIVLLITFIWIKETRFISIYIPL